MSERDNKTKYPQKRKQNDSTTQARPFFTSVSYTPHPRAPSYGADQRSLPYCTHNHRFQPLPPTHPHPSWPKTFNSLDPLHMNLAKGIGMISKWNLIFIFFNFFSGESWNLNST
jgi:hypothetical protein